MEMIGRISVPKKSISVFLIFLLMVIPVYSSFVVAKIDYAQGVIVQRDESEESFETFLTGFAVNESENISYVPDVGGKCSEKSGDVNILVEAMDNEVIATLEKIFSIMNLIVTTTNAINSILNAVYMGWACCAPNPYNAAACTGQETKMKAWSMPFTTIIKPLGCITSCSWCSGDGAAGEGECFGVVGEVLSGMALLKNTPGIVSVPQKGGEIGDTKKAEAGLSQFHISPYDNIYTAVGCMCPGAILFNMRKLKTIYQTYDCCIEESCENGLSTNSCERQLSEATCMYWEGSIYQSLVKAVLSFLTGILFTHLATVIGQLGLGAILYCGLAIWDIAHIPETIEGVKAAWKWTSVSFKEPSCGDLGFDELKESQEAGIWSEKAGTSRLALNDLDGDGIYDSIARNYGYEKLSKEERAKLGDKFSDYKDQAVYKYTTADESGQESVYYKVKEKGFLKGSKIIDDSGKDVESKDWKEKLKGSVAPVSTDIEGMTYNTIYYGGKNQAYEFGTFGLDVTDAEGNKETIPFEKLVGKDVELGGVNLKDSTSYDGLNFVFEDGKKLWISQDSEKDYRSFFIDEANGDYSYGYQFNDGEVMEIVDIVPSKNIDKRILAINVDGIEFKMKDSEAFLNADIETFRESLRIANEKGALSEVEEVKFASIKRGNQVIGNKLTWVAEGSENSVESVAESLDKRTIYKIKENDKVNYAKETSDGKIIKISGDMVDVANLRNEFAAREVLGGEYDDYKKESHEDGMAYVFKNEKDVLRGILIVTEDGSSSHTIFNEKGLKIELTESNLEGTAVKKYENGVLKTEEWRGRGDDGSLSLTNYNGDNIEQVIMDNKDNIITSRSFTNTIEGRTLNIKYDKNKENPETVKVLFDGDTGDAFEDEYIYDIKTGKFKGETKLTKEEKEKIIAAIEKDIKKNEETRKKNKIEGTTPEARAIFEQNEKDFLAQKSYELTWELLNGVLGEFAYEYIDEMCKEDE